MKGDALPYHLRPHKAVDRRLFLDLLARYERWRPLVDFAYVSMGAYPLEDHKQVHRHLGIGRLISFDSDKNIVARQTFNRPVGSCACLCRKSAEVVDEFDDVLREGNAEDAAGVIVWLDYTAPRDIGKQIREFQTLLNKLQDSDVVRVTVNANPASLFDGKKGDGSHYDGKEMRERRFEVIEKRIEEYLPSDAGADDMDKDGYPVLLSRAFGRAATQALPLTGKRTFVPLSLVRYADGQQMLSITGAVVERNRVGEMREAIGIERWPYGVSDWGDVRRLAVPDLTLRERLFLEQKIAESEPEKIAADLGFELGNGMNTSQFIQDYRNFYRFYPSLLAAEV
ncbi:O-methyltransferase [Thiorhodococcus minor]|uniref:Three-Cys-motif partner protein TcmP n=1 Tax=Thiorhodococcus minor TaxID=57489 RepID=A0A6M0K1W3_9GAMM|nr:O-methyltransferase [Thiorhodococcus minor]NEV63748.1 hypothetical protein [Thiorhodococcus minor]